MIYLLPRFSLSLPLKSCVGVLLTTSSLVLPSTNRFLLKPLKFLICLSLSVQISKQLALSRFLVFLQELSLESQGYLEFLCSPTAIMAVSSGPMFMEQMLRKYELNEKCSGSKVDSMLASLYTKYGVAAN